MYSKTSGKHGKTIARPEKGAFDAKAARAMMDETNGLVFLVDHYQTPTELQNSMYTVYFFI